MDAPFLSRFEKHVLSYEDIITSEHSKLIEKLESWVEETSTCIIENSSVYYPQTFIGFNEDTLYTIALKLIKKEKNNENDQNEEKNFQDAKELLISTMSLDSILRLSKTRVLFEEQKMICQVYFKKQGKLSFSSFWNTIKKENHRYTLISTFSEFSEINECIMKERMIVSQGRLISIDSYKKEKDFEKMLKEFYQPKNRSNVLAIYLEPHTHSDLLYQIGEMIENVEKEKDTYKTTIIFLRITRSLMKNKYSTWSFSQLSSWKQTHIDKISSFENDFPRIVCDIVTKKNENLWKYKEILLEQGTSFSFNAVFEQVLFWCFLTIKNGEKESVESRNILRETILKDKDFVEFIKEKILNWLEIQDASWQKQSFDKIVLEQWKSIEMVCLEGTKEIVKLPLTDFICKIENEYALYNYFSAPSNLKPHWKRITEIKLFQIADSSQLSLKTEFVVEKREDLEKVESLLKFPFSFMFFEHLSSLEVDALKQENLKYPKTENPFQMLKQIGEKSEITRLLHQKWVFESSLCYFLDFSLLFSRKQKLNFEKSNEVTMKLFSILFPNIFIGERINIFLLHLSALEKKDQLKHIFFLFNEGKVDPNFILDRSNQNNFVENLIESYCKKILELLRQESVDDNLYTCENLIVSIDYLASVNYNKTLFQTKILQTFVSEVGKTHGCSLLVKDLDQIFSEHQEKFFEFNWIGDFFKFFEEISNTLKTEAILKINGWLGNVFSRIILYLNSSGEDDVQIAANLLGKFIILHSNETKIKLSFPVQIFSNLITKVSNNNINMFIEIATTNKISEENNFLAFLEDYLCNHSKENQLEDSNINNIITDSLENSFLNKYVEFYQNSKTTKTKEKFELDLQKCFKTLLSNSNTKIPKLCSLSIIRSTIKVVAQQFVSKKSSKLTEIIGLSLNENNFITPQLKLYLVKNIFSNQKELDACSCLDHWGKQEQFKWMSDYIPKKQEIIAINPFLKEKTIYEQFYK